MIVAAEKQNKVVGSLLAAMRSRDLGFSDEVAVPTAMSRARTTAKRVKSMVLPARSDLVIKNALFVWAEHGSGGSSNGPSLVKSDAASKTVGGVRLLGALLSSLNETEADISAAKNLANSLTTPEP